MIVDEPSRSPVTDSMPASKCGRPPQPASRAHQRVRVYVGTSERLGKVIPLGSRARPDQDHIAPGESAYCQIRVSRPLLAMRGDRFILRDETGQRTVGGGTVILPAAPIHKRSDPALLHTLETFELGERAGAAFHRGAGRRERRVHDRSVVVGSAAPESPRGGRAPPASTRSTASMCSRGDGGVHYASEEACRDVKHALTESPGALAHRASAGRGSRYRRRTKRSRSSRFHPGFSGCSSRSSSSSRPSCARATCCVSPAHRIVVPDADARLAERITALLGRTPLSPPDVKQIADELVVDRRKLIELMRAMEKGRSIVWCRARDLFSRRLHRSGERGARWRTLGAAVGSPPPSSAIATTPPANMRFPCLNSSIAPV